MGSKRLTFAALLIGCFSNWNVTIVQAGTPNQDFDAQAKLDSQIIADSLNRSFANSAGFFASLGWNNPSCGFESATGTRMELGLDFGLDFISFPSFSSLPLGALSGPAIVHMPVNLPALYPAIMGRITLFNRFDLGVRLTYLPVVTFYDTNITTNFIGYGLNTRLRILQGEGLPDLSLGLSWANQNGNFSLASEADQNSTYKDPTDGLTYNAMVAGRTFYSMNWDVKSFGIKMVLGKNLGFVYPFIALGLQAHSGTISSKLSGSVTETLSGPPGGGTSNPDITASSSGSPIYSEPEYAIGIDSGGSFHWTLVGQSNGTDVAISMGFHTQY